MTDITVKTTTSIPKLYYSVLYGVTNQEQARAWGNKMGYSTVYWHKRLERVYGIIKAKKESEEK